VAFLAASAPGLLLVTRNIHFEANKLSHQLGYSLATPLAHANFQRDRLPVHVAEFAKPLLKCHDHASSHVGA